MSVTASTTGASALPQRDWRASLHSAGRRVTRQRLAVLAAADSAPHLDAEHIWQAARGELTELTLQSVYTVLTDLTALGLLRKIEPSSGPARYETRVGDNHHHAICIRCGKIEDVDCAVGHAPCLEAATSMTVLRAEVTFSGICADCAAAGSDQVFTPPQPITQGES